MIIEQINTEREQVMARTYMTLKEEGDLHRYLQEQIKAIPSSSLQTAALSPPVQADVT